MTAKYSRIQAREWQHCRGGAAREFPRATALLNADRGILLVEDEVLALPEVQEQCAQFQVVVRKGNHYVNYYRRKRHCLAVMADPRDSPDTQWMRDWMTDLQVIRPLDRSETLTGG